MRYGRNDLPESIWALIDKFEMGLISGKEEVYAVYGKHQKAWWKAYGRATMAWLAGLLASLVGGGALINVMRGSALEGASRVVAGLALGGVVLWGVLALIGNRRLLTTQELEAILPALDASESEKAFLQSLVALEGHPTMPADMCRETRLALCDLMREQQALIQAKQTMAAAAPESTLDSLQKERESLADRIARTNDPQAIRTFEDSMHLLDERIEGYSRIAPHLERIDAQLEMIYQTVRGANEAIVRSRSAPGGISRDFDALRSRLQEARSYARSVEQAVAELAQG